jgi:sorbose reductase
MGSIDVTPPMSGPLKGGDFVHDNTLAPSEKRILSLFSNKGKTAIVSGAGAGIGLAVAEGLAESGANVAIWYNSNKKAVERAAGIEAQYGVKCKTKHEQPRVEGLANDIARPRLPGRRH